MQQHTGQHVLSAAFERLPRRGPRAFTSAPTSATIDLARELSPARDCPRRKTRRTGSSGRTGRSRSGSPMPRRRRTLPLRKEPSANGTLRLIDVEDFDLSACGGTHVARTGAIGIIAVAGSERFRGGSRREFLCGGRALRRLPRAAGRRGRRASGCCRDAGGTAGGDRAPAGGRQGLRRQIKDLQARLAGARSRRARRPREPHGVRLVVAALEGWDAGGAEDHRVAHRRASRARGRALRRPRRRVVVARAPDGRSMRRRPEAADGDSAAKAAAGPNWRRAAE